MSPQPAVARSAVTPRIGVYAVLAALLLIPLAIEILGFRSAHLLSQDLWTPLGLHHLARYTLLFALLAVPLATLLRGYLLSAIIAAIVIGSVVAVGPLAAGSVILFAFSATVLGRLIFGRDLEARLAFMAGLAIWIIVLTLSARLPIHYVATYCCGLSIPILLGYQEARRLGQEWLRLFRSRPITATETLALLLLAFVLLAHWLVVLKPEASTDGLATHLVVPFDMARFHVFHYDVRHYVWSLMPLGTDFAYGVMYLLGGEYAARLLNFGMLAATAVLLFNEARRFVSNSVAILMAAAFLSTPLVQLVTGSLFVENFVAAMCLAGVAALWRYRETRTGPYLILTALLLGTAISLKLAAFAVALMSLPFLAGAIPKSRVALFALGGFLSIASIPYVTAWWISGNPIFPFANNLFHSPYAGNDLVDVRFHPALSWSTPIRLTIETHEYFEGQDGTFGFQYLLLIPLTLAYVLSRRSLSGISFAVIGIGGAVIIALTLPNARYFYSTLPFLTLAAAAALSWIASRYRSLFAAGLAAIVVASIVNIYFLPGSNWHHQDFYTSPLLRASGRQEYLDGAAPVREVVAFLNRTAPAEPVLYADGSQIAGLLAPAYRNAWHDYAFQKQLEACPTAQALNRLLVALGVQHIIMDHYVTARGAPLAGIIAKCADPEYRLGNFSALKLRPDCERRLAENID